MVDIDFDNRPTLGPKKQQAILAHFHRDFSRVSKEEMREALESGAFSIRKYSQLGRATMCKLITWSEASAPVNRKEGHYSDAVITRAVTLLESEGYTVLPPEATLR